MKNLSILNPNTGDIVGVAKYDAELKSGQLVNYKDEEGNEFEGKVSFAKKWNTDKYHGVEIVYIAQRKPDSEYTKKYRDKRQTKTIKADLYLDDPTEQQIYECWQNETDKKALLVKLLKEHYKQS